MCTTFVLCIYIYCAFIEKNMFKLKSPALLAASQLVLNFMKEKEIFESPVGWGCVTLVSLETRQLQLYEVDDIPWTNFF